MINLAAISLNYFGVSWLFNLLPQGIITLNLIDLFFQGVLFISLGIIGEYVEKYMSNQKEEAHLSLEIILKTMSNLKVINSYLKEYTDFIEHNVTAFVKDFLRVSGGVKNDRRYFYGKWCKCSHMSHLANDFSKALK